MSRLPFESEYLYGLHDPGGEHTVRDAGRRGWILFTEEVGHDPAVQRRNDRYAALSKDGFGIVVRLNNGYYKAGTLPHSSQYDNFARCCANFVANSPGAHIWIIGNETNFAAERPGVEIAGWRGAEAPIARDFRDLLSIFAATGRGDEIVNPGETITPELYVRCYTLCRNAIHNIAGHQSDLVLIGAVAPWNMNSGDWIDYFRRILELLGPDCCDGISLHTYTHGTNPDYVYSAEKMQTHPNRHYHFRAYQDFMHAVPDNMRRLPVYITEMDQNDAWDLGNRGWVQRAYGEIDDWNRQPGHQQIRAAILYRWQQHEGHKWWIDGNQGVIADFRQALESGYRWNAGGVPAPAPAVPVFSLGQQVLTQTIVNLRSDAGRQAAVVQSLPRHTRVTVTGASRERDGMIWWPVSVDWDGQRDSWLDCPTRRCQRPGAIGHCLKCSLALESRRPLGKSGLRSRSKSANCAAAARHRLRHLPADSLGLIKCPSAAVTV